MGGPSRSGLSSAADVLLRRLSEHAGDDVDCDVLIVGSGYGGSVAAARLAGSVVTAADGKTRPARVWLLERGAEYSPGMFPSRFSELAGHVRFNTQSGQPSRGRDEGLFDLRVGGDVSALLGNGLGGGSLINAGVMAEPDPQVFAAGWPAAITAAELQPAYALALGMLTPQTMAPADASARWQSFQRVGTTQGQAPSHCPIAVNLGAAAANAAGVTLQPCTHCGDCVTGCNQGAKGTLDTNYLAWAQARGVEIFCGGVVQHLLRNEAGTAWLASWQFTDRTRRLPDVEPYCIRARQVLLAAGAFGSTEILLRSQRLGLPVSGQLGTRVSTNGDFLAAGVGHRQPVRSSADAESDPARREARDVGPTITGWVKVPQPAAAVPIVVEEFAVPAALRHVFGEIVSTMHAVRIGATPPGAGDDPKAVTDAFIDRCSLFGMMGDDGAAGRFELPLGANTGDHEGALTTHWNDVTRLNVFKQQTTWLKAGLVPHCDRDPPMLEHPLHAFGIGALTVHPLGGCPMGDRFEAGVVNAEGQVFREGTQTHPGLAVLDGAIVPRALGINPALTIAALAERAVPLLMAQWGLSAGAGDVEPARQRTVAARRELPAPRADWLLRERVHGPMTFGAQTVWAQLDIEFEPIPGLARALALNPHVLNVKRASLTLWAAPAGATAITFEPQAADALCTAELTGRMCLFEPNAVAGEPPLRLSYQLSVQSVQALRPMGAGGASLLQVGRRFDGVKRFGETKPRLPAPDPLWRQLTEMTVRYDGGAGVGQLSLDLNDLATQREPLLRLVGLSTMPDALADGGALLLYVLRQAMPVLLQHIFNPPKTIDPHHLNERFPSPLNGLPAFEVMVLNDAGARLSRYAQPSGVEPELPPVVLIHGLGTSGSTFAHSCVPHNLVRFLHGEGRDVWVLDLRSSVGNEPMRHDPRTASWTVDSVARDDIPAAVQAVLTRTGAEKVDVVAHCMGAVMFYFAALGNQAMARQVRAVVLSQVGPLARLSPLNRLRGYLASYLQQFLGIDELDTSPEFESVVNPATRHVSWRPSTRPAIQRLLKDLLPNSFPYPDGDDELARFLRMGAPDFRAVRHRADMIFGQLFELNNVGDTTLANLDALFGWVKVKMLAQSIHFARHNMLTDASGRNTVFDQALIAKRFPFPLLIIHGRQNRVFDWRGSRDSLKLLKQLRGEALGKPPVIAAPVELHGADTPTQLALIETYGHFDCVIGEKAHQDVFPVLSTFFNSDVARTQARAQVPPLACEVPWIGPMLGWLRTQASTHGELLLASVLVRAPARRARTLGVAIVPVALTANGPVADLSHARVLRCAGPMWRQLGSRLPADLEEGAMSLVFNAQRLHPGFDTFAVLTLHDDLPLPALALERLGDAAALHGPLITPAGVALGGIAAEQLAFDLAVKGGEWLLGGHVPTAREADGLAAYWAQDDVAQRLPASLFSLTPKVRAAADTAWPAPPAADASTPAPTAAPLRFALASCQYPPGLLDEVCAGASYARMQRDAAAADGPQFALLVGDQVYVDATAGVFEPTVIAGDSAAGQRADLDRAYALNWRLPGFRRTAALMPCFMMLDDHEVANNWQPPLGGAPSPAESAALAAFERYQQVLNPTTPIGAAGARSFQMSPAGVPFWVLDTRSRRQARQVGACGPATAWEVAEIIPAAEMDALCAALKAAPAGLVKFIVTPSPLLPPERCIDGDPEDRLRSDSGSGYPHSVSHLLRFIRDNNIRRVVLLSGDAHLSSVSTFAFDGVGGAASSCRVVSVVSSGLYTPWPFANQAASDLLLSGSHDLGPAAAPCRGEVSLFAMSAQSGYAVLAVDAVGTCHSTLHVTLRASNGAGTAVSLPLD